jgi:hypothetical protein
MDGVKVFSNLLSLMDPNTLVVSWGVFGKVVVASPAQHPGRGQPEAGYNSPPLLFGCLAQPSLAAPRWCLGSNWQHGWQPNYHQLFARGDVWRQARPPNRDM